MQNMSHSRNCTVKLKLMVHSEQNIIYVGWLGCILALCMYNYNIPLLSLYHHCKAFTKKILKIETMTMEEVTYCGMPSTYSNKISYHAE